MAEPSKHIHIERRGLMLVISSPSGAAGSAREGSWMGTPLSRPFARPATGRIAVKVINHLGDEVMKVFRVGAA